MITEFIGPVLLFATFMLVFPFFAVAHGAMTTRTVSRVIVRVRGDEERFSKWGMDQEMYGLTTLKYDIIVTSVGLVILVVLGVYNYLWLVGIESEVNGRYNIDSEIVRGYFTLCGIVWYIGITWTIWRLSDSFSKAKALNDLPQEFLKSYTKLDILSLYDSLRFAPSPLLGNICYNGSQGTFSSTFGKVFGLCQPISAPPLC